MTGRLLVGIVLLTPAACGGSGEGAELQPGRWEVKAELVNAALPQQPDAEASTPAGTTMTKIVCIPAERARRADIDVLIPWPVEGGTCRNSLSTDAGRLRGRSDCAFDGGSIQVATTFEGEYDAQSYVLRGRAVSEQRGTPGTSTIETHWNGRRTGECRGDEETLPPA